LRAAIFLASAAWDRSTHAEHRLGFGRIVASETERPNRLVILIKRGRAVVQSDNTTDPYPLELCAAVGKVRRGVVAPLSGGFSQHLARERSRRQVLPRGRFSAG
jgi:hypothetical protein